MDTSARAGIAGVLLAILVAACEAAPPVETAFRSDSAGVEIVENSGPVWGEEDRWRLSPEPILAIEASADGAAVMLGPRSIVVDSRGRVLVADGFPGGTNEILVFDRSGTLLTRIGREGEGPGEFQQLLWASVFQGDSIAAYDQVGYELSVFGSDGTFVRQMRIPEFGLPPAVEGPLAVAPGIERPFRDGSFLAFTAAHLETARGVGPAWAKHRIMQVTADAAGWNELGVFDMFEQHWSGERPVSPLWFGGATLRAVSSDHWYWSPGNSFEFRRYRGGDLERVVRRAFQARTVDDALRSLFADWYLEYLITSFGDNEQTRDAYQTLMGRSQYAAFMPAVSDLIVDDVGNVWAEAFRWMAGTTSPIPGPTLWSVFDSTGSWLGEVETPSGLVVELVEQDEVFGFMEDQLGARELHVYRLEKP